MTTFQKLFYTLFFFVGYFGLIKGIISALMNIAAQNWPRIKATMFEVEKETKYDEEYGESYKIKVIYGYKYKGHNYKSKRIAFGYVGNTSEQIAEALYHKYQKGNEVKVYVNPRKPRVSVLMAKLRYFHIIAVLMSLAFVLACHYSYNSNL